MGHLLFVRERALLVQRFDAGKLQLAGEAIPVAEPVDRTLFRTRASLSETGVLVYHAGVAADLRLHRFDRGGKALETVGPPGDYLNVDLSRDGRRLAADRTDRQTGNRDIWLFDLARGARTRFTFRPAFNGNPVWSPDGRWLLYSEQDPKTRMDVWLLPLDRRQPQPWLRAEFDEGHGQFSPDGQWVAYDSNESGRDEVVS